MMQGATGTQGNKDHVALGGLGRLANGLRHSARLAMSEADAALLVAYNDERGGAETTAALDHLGDTIDVNELFDDAVGALLAVTAALAAAFPWFLCHVLILVLFRKHGLLNAGAPTSGRRR